MSHLEPAGNVKIIDRYEKMQGARIFSYRAVARLCGSSPPTVHRVVQAWKANPESIWRRNTRAPRVPELAARKNDVLAIFDERNKAGLPTSSASLQERFALAASRGKWRTKRVSVVTPARTPTR